MAVENPLRILCTREFMSSMADSVHKLLVDQIYSMGLQSFFTIEKATITGANGSEFRFAGIRTNVSAIKSFEGIDIAFVEEAANVSKASWETLVPTIRKPGSRIIISFNPELETDETYKRFVLNPPPNCISVKVNWSDNPFFPDVLKDEMEYLKRIDYPAYLNVWEGFPKSFLEGSIYYNQLRECQEQGRITEVKYDSLKPVFTFFDLGWNDSTSIWFAQVIGSEYRFIDFYENNHQPIDHYLQVMQAKQYTYHTDFLPHDARAKSLGTGKSIEELMREKGRSVRITNQLSVNDGINAVRTAFPNCWFDKEKCVDGLNALRHYRYDPDSPTHKPLHDENSHAADGFRYACVMLGDNLGSKRPNMEKIKKIMKSSGQGFTSQHGWMSA